MNPSSSFDDYYADYDEASKVFSSHLRLVQNSSLQAATPTGNENGLVDLLKTGTNLAQAFLALLVDKLKFFNLVLADQVRTCANWSKCSVYKCKVYKYALVVWVLLLTLVVCFLYSGEEVFGSLKVCIVVGHFVPVCASYFEIETHIFISIPRKLIL